MKSKGRNLAKVTYALAGLLMILTVFSLVSINDSADAQASFSIAGKITEVDAAKQTLTVKAPTGQSMSFRMADRFTTMRGNKILNFGDIKVGDDAKVWYYQKTTGEHVAYDITLF
jgi:hypothetical protein